MRKVRVKFSVLLLFLFAFTGFSSLRGQIHDEPPPDLAAGKLWKMGDSAGQTALKLSDFTVLLTLDASAADGVVAEVPTAWRLMKEGSGFHFHLNQGEQHLDLQTQAVLPEQGQVKVAISIQRDARQALSGLWIDGVEKVSAQMKQGELVMDAATLHAAKALKDITIYDRALVRQELLEWMAEDDSSQASGLVLMGGTEACTLFEDGRWEAVLRLGGEERHQRSLAWEGDTVFAQSRPMGFGSLKSQLNRVQADSVWLMFGRQEALETGKAGVEAFKQALQNMAAGLKPLVREIVIVGLAPVESKGAPLPDLQAANEVLIFYSDAMKTVAAEQGLRFVDVLAAWPKEEKDFTRDGLQLNEHGVAVLASILAGKPLEKIDATLVQTVRSKNRMWLGYWRPTNWAFLHGDRTAQPSSRDHVDPRIRWFPSETEGYLQRIMEKEKEIAVMAKEQGGKLP